MFISFIIGFVLGLSALFLRPLLRALGLRLRHPLGRDEEYLLRAARTAGGRLILRKEQASSGAYILVLKEFADAQRLEHLGQVECLLARGLLIPDASGVAGRYTLTPLGWTRVKRLPALPIPLRRTGAWFNSISRRTANPRKPA